MNRINVFVRRQRIKKLENWTMRAILFEAFFVMMFPGLAAAGVFVGIVTWFLRVQTDTKFKIRSLNFDVPIAIFVVFGVISVFMSPAKSFPLIYNYCALMGVYVLSYFLVGQNIRTPEQIKTFAKAIAASGFFVVLYGYFQYFFGIDPTDIKWVDPEAFPELKTRIFSTLENPNILAGYLDVLICLALGLFAKVKGRYQKAVIVAAIVMLLFCLVLTYSRGAFVAIAIIFLIYGILYDIRILIAFVLAVALAFYGDQNFTDRIFSVFNSTDTSEGLRIGIWISTIAMIADHPFIGIGWGAYKFIYPQYNYYLYDTSNIIYHAHNLYLNTAAEVGIVGALAFFWYFFGTMFSSLTLRKNKNYEKIKNGIRDVIYPIIAERFVKVFLNGKFLQTLANAKSLLMLRMADLSEKIMDLVSFTPSEKEMRRAGKKDEDITDEEISDEGQFFDAEKLSDEEKNFGVEKNPDEKKSDEPELVHHEELKWSSPPLSETLSDDDKKSLLEKNSGAEKVSDETKTFDAEKIIAAVKADEENKNLSEKNSDVEEVPDDTKTFDAVKNPEEKIPDVEKVSDETKISTDKKSDDDNKMDLQKFASDDVFGADFNIQRAMHIPDENIIGGLRIGIGLAFLSMALNGVSDHLLFNVSSSVLMWQLGALSGAINLLPNKK